MMGDVQAPLTIHGGDILSTARHLGVRVDELVDMSSNLSPFGMLPGLKAELAARLDEVAFLPEAGSETLVGRFAERFGLAEDQVLAGNGTTEFIYAIPQGVSRRRAVIVTPTYADYALACEWAGLVVEEFPLSPADGFRLDPGRLAGRLQGGELVFICNPNNPTAGVVASAELRELITARPDSLFVVDESYLPFVRQPSLLELGLADNLLLLSSFSKIYGMPGLRLGFLAAGQARLEKIFRRRKPWGVNRLAQVAGEYALASGQEYAGQVAGFVAEERPRLAGMLAGLAGVEVVPGEANFILARLSGRLTAGDLRRRLLAQRIMIRNCGNFSGLDDRYFRISLKDRQTNSRCLAAIKAVLEEEHHADSHSLGQP